MWGGLWLSLAEVWSAVMASRLVLILIAIVLLLFSSGQGEELSASLLIAPAYNNWLLFTSVFAWAAQSWLWARISVELTFVPASDLFPTPSAAQNIKLLIIGMFPVACAVGVFLAALLHLVHAEK